MSDTHDIEVHTVYAVKEVAPPAGVRLQILGLITFVVALAWLYTTWQPMFYWIQKTLAFGEINVDMGSTKGGAKGNGFGAFAGVVNTAKGQAGSSGRAASRVAPAKGEAATSAAKARADKQHAKMALRLGAGGWLGTATIVGLWLAMSGVAGWSPARRLRRVGWVLLPLSLLVAVALAWHVWRVYEWYFSILPEWVMPVMLGLCITSAASVGALLNRRGVGLLRAGGYLVILSAVVSMASIWSAVHWGQMPAEQVGAALYAKIFGVQSGYGWVLLLGTIGLR